MLSSVGNRIPEVAPVDLRPFLILYILFNKLVLGDEHTMIPWTTLSEYKKGTHQSSKVFHSNPL